MVGPLKNQYGILSVKLLFKSVVIFDNLLMLVKKFLMKLEVKLQLTAARHPMRQSSSPLKWQKWRIYDSNLPLLLAHPEGFEPPACRFEVSRFIQCPIDVI